LLLRAAQEWGIDLAASYLIGDALSDVEAALAAGCQPILVRTGRGQEQERLLRERWPHVPVVEDLGEAVEWILENGKWRQENGT
jgi:D-glycero-D-manno-heptose 1,7-bisphosphate phosphatase